MHLHLTNYYFMKNQLIGTNRENNIVLLGAQGPSVFFYGFAFLREDSYVGNPCYQYYNLLVKDSVFETLKTMFDFVSIQVDETKKTVLLAYLRGYLNAYSLSRNTQPYVYYFGGYEVSNSPWDKHSLNRYSLETKLDILYEQSIRESTPFKQIFRVAKDDVLAISEMFYHLAIDVYSLPNITKRTYYNAYSSMKTRLSILNGESVAFSRTILSMMNKNHVNVFIRSNRVEHTDKYDFLNLRKRIWKHPSEGVELDITFLDLINEVKDETLLINAILRDFTAGKDITKQLKHYSMNLNYLGLPIDRDPIYFDVIFKENENGTESHY